MYILVCIGYRLRGGILIYHDLKTSLVPIRSRPWQKTVWQTESIFLAVEAIDIM